MATNMIDNLLSEFYHPTTPNDRKRQIENELIAYRNHPNSWQQSLCVLQYHDNFQTNQFLWFFNASIIECTIMKRWNTIKHQDRVTIRDTLWKCYTTLPTSSSSSSSSSSSVGINEIPKRQRDTIAQLIVLMGKRDFPDEHPDYMNNIIALLECDNSILGIVLLRITSEEILNSRDNLSSDKRKYFHSCISLYLPKVIDVIGKILHMSVCELNLQTTTTTTNSSLPNDNQKSKLLIELLSCTQHLFSWISLDLISDYFLVNILELSKWRENHNEISIEAILILNELFYVQRSIQLPDILIKGIKGLLQQNDLNKSNEQYQDKLTELLRLYSSKYWSKLLSDNELFHNLVVALYQYTFSGCGALAFTEKLEIWTPLIKGLIATNNNGKYLDIMHSLVGGILKKMQFSFDQEQTLDMLDNEILDENMETEWQHYLTQCIETIANITEYSPITVFDQVYNDWQNAFEMFLTLEKSINNNSNNRNNNGKLIIIIENQTKCHFIHCMLRDLSSLCQTLIRLTAVIEQYYENCVDKLINIKQFLLYLIKFLSNNQIHCINTENTFLKSDISELFSQTILALRSLLGCTLMLNSDTEFKDLIDEIGKILLPTKQESVTVKLAAAQFLLRTATVIRPKFMLECNSILQLMQFGPKLSHLPKNVIVSIYQTIFSCLVLPWRNIEMQNQSYDHRNIVLQDYVTCLANDFLQIDNTTTINEQQLKTSVTVILPILKEVIDYFIDSNSSTKQILTNSLRSVIVKSLFICQNYGFTNIEVAEVIFDFLLSVIKCFQIQLGSVFVQQMVSIFLEILSREQLNNNRLKILEKILRMLILIVEQPGSFTMTLIPSILNLSINQILPWLQDEKNFSNNSDSACLLYSLFDRILQYRWQYFYKSQILRGFSPGASDYPIPNDDEPQHKDQLLAILTSYGRILVNGNDPHLCRIILTSLQELNVKWKLYNRDFFKNNLLNSFQHAIITVLFSNEGIIYQDLLLNTLFEMGQVNTCKLHDTFVSLGYKDSKTLNDICTATDLPTFSHKVAQLIQDIQKPLME